MKKVEIRFIGTRLDNVSYEIDVNGKIAVHCESLEELSQKVTEITSREPVCVEFLDRFTLCP